MSQQLPFKNVVFGLACLAAISSVGCQRDRGLADARNPGGPAYGFNGEIGAVEADGRDLPPMIEGLFRDDHPEATITGVRRYVGKDGESTYELSYLDRGIPQRTSYFDDGQARNLASPTVVRNVDRDDYRPMHSPTTPATRPAGLEAFD